MRILDIYTQVQCSYLYFSISTGGWIYWVQLAESLCYGEFRTKMIAYEKKLGCWSWVGFALGGVANCFFVLLLIAIISLQYAWPCQQLELIKYCFLQQAALVLNASRRFRYTLDLKKEEDKKEIIRKIRTHAQVVRVCFWTLRTLLVYIIPFEIVFHLYLLLF